MIKLPELTEECLEKFLSHKDASIFLDDKAKDLIRELFRKDRAIGFKSGMFQVMKR